jgi:hypothetical protein
MFRGPHLKFLIVSLLSGAFFSLSSVETALGQLMEDIDTPPAVSAPSDVLWDQTAGISSTDISSQDFTDSGGSLDHFDTRAADDFLVPDGFFWVIRTIYAFGAFDDNPPDIIDSLNIYFFADKDGLPGNEVARCVYKDILPEDITVPNFVIDLPLPCKLEPGVYWISVQANIAFIQNGQWFWHENTIQRLSPFVWENPGDGFGTGCVQFTPAQANCGADSPDLSFQLTGQGVPIIRPIPTLSEWGMISISVILGVIGICAFIFMKKRKVQA